MGAFRLRLSKMENGELNLLQQSDNFKRPTELPIWLYDHFVPVQLHVALLRTAVHLDGSKRSRWFKNPKNEPPIRHPGKEPHGITISV